jgi:acetylornithine deacetylase/succinyl-diaminopimelate desuccinylase-like protein
MNRIEALTAEPRIQAALASFRSHEDKAEALIFAIQQIAAPTFHEKRRADFVQSRFHSLGLFDVVQDELHNVYGRLPGNSTGDLAPVVLSAHLDTVFPADTDLTLRREAKLLHGPGAGDNATGVAGLLLLAESLSEHALRPAADIWFVANVGEEGLGDLRGMRAVVKRFGKEPYYIIAEGGLYGQISNQGIGVRRFRIDVTAEGGHSWGSFGNASAVHALGRIIAAIDGLEVPASPKTTYNVGVIEGGTSINTIAQSANLLLDLRSEEVDSLTRLEKRVEEIVASSNGSGKHVATMTLIGDRPAGRLSPEAPLVSWAVDALQYVGCQQIEFMAGSTDANIPLSQGLNAVCVGLAQSGNTHRLDEYVDLTNFANGMGQLLLLVLAAAEI